MSVIDVDEKAFLSRMVHNPHQEWAPVDRDLQLFYDALQQQIRLTTVLQRQWIELGKDDHVALATPAARILLIVRRLDAVRVTRDHISRAGSRFVVTNLLYKDMVPDTAREEMGRRVEEVLRLMDEHRTLLTTLISGMEKDLLKAENDFRTGPCSTNVEQVNALFRRAFDTLTWSDKDKSEKRFAELQSKIEEQAHELATLKEQLTSKASCEDKAAEIAPSDSDYFHNMVEEVMGPEEPPPLVDEPSDDDEGDGEGSFDESEVGTIDEYQEEGLDEIRVDEPMEVAVHEQRVVEWVWQAPAPDERRDRVEDEGRQVDEQAQEVRPPEEVDQRVEAMNEEDEAIQQLRRRIEVAQDRFDALHRAFMKFPYRKREERSPRVSRKLQCAFCFHKGEHFSDSCPNVVSSEERLEIALEEGVHLKCLKMCWAALRCTHEDKVCFYCESLNGTPFEHLKWTEEEHHTALCCVPDRKRMAREMVEQAREELRELTGELARMTRDRNRNRQMRNDNED